MCRNYSADEFVRDAVNYTKALGPIPLLGEKLRPGMNLFTSIFFYKIRTSAIPEVKLQISLAESGHLIFLSERSIATENMTQHLELLFSVVTKTIVTYHAGFSPETPETKRQLAELRSIFERFFVFFLEESRPDAPMTNITLDELQELAPEWVGTFTKLSEHLMVKHLRTPGDKEVIEHIGQNVLVSFLEVLDENPWLTPESRAILKKRLINMQNMLGYNTNAIDLRAAEEIAKFITIPDVATPFEWLKMTWRIRWAHENFDVGDTVVDRAGTSLTGFQAENVHYKAHPFHPVRFNGNMKNFEEFATAFKCPLNSPMNPKNKCRVWRRIKKH
ncbi:unnamed protein product, partial [Mesorhabditis spiculigera]